MSNPYVGEIRVFAGNFAPNGWAFCNGQLLAISEYDVLFNLIGTTYGGDGQQTFALPDLQGRAPMHWGTGGGGSYTIGELGGVEAVTLTTQQIPSHTHTVSASSLAGTSNSPSGTLFAQPGDGIKPYRAGTPGTAMATPISPAGSSQPHDNFQPSLAVNFILSLFGIYPSPT